MANFALPQGAARLGYRALAATGTYAELPWKTLNISDDSVNVDTTTTVDRSGGIQFLSSMTTAVGLTIDVETLRMHDGGTTPANEEFVNFFEDLWLKNGSLRYCELQLIPPEAYALSGGTGGGTFAITFTANLESCVGQGGGVTDASGMKLKLKSVGAITQDNDLP